MLIFPIKRVWTSQPQCSVTPSSGVSVAVIPSYWRVEVVTSQGLTEAHTSLRTTRKTGSRWQYIDFSAHAAVGLKLPVSIVSDTFATDNTYVLYIRCPSTSGFIANRWNTTATTSAYGGMWAFEKSGTALIVRWNDGSGTLQSRTISGVTLTTGSDTCIVLKTKSGTATLYQDGILRDSWSFTVPSLGSSLFLGSSLLKLGNTSTVNDGFAGGIYLFAVINGARKDAKELSLTPWQIFSPQQQLISLTSGNSTTYNITPSGSISFSGTSVRNNTKILSNSGIITFNGSAPITLVNGSTTYTITPSGTISLTGSASNIRSKVLSSGGLVTLSGSSIFKRTRTFLSTGVLSMLGTSITNKTKLYTPTGNVTFSGTATMYMPGVTVQTTKLPLTGVGT